MNSIVQEQRPEPIPKPDGPGNADYPHRGVTIRVDESPRPGSDRRARVLSQSDIAEERALATVQEVSFDTPEHPPAALAEAEPDSCAMLLEAAQALKAARAQLTFLDECLAELGAKSLAIDKLKATLDGAREQRGQLLGDAMIAGRRPNTSEVDKRCESALVALEKRRDEVTALERALSSLQVQRSNALRALTEFELAYVKTREKHLQVIKFTRTLVRQFHEGATNAHARLVQMSARFRERMLSANVDRLSDQLPPVAILQELVIAQAKADLITADEQAAIPPPPVPQCLGYVWAGGQIHDEPEAVIEPDPAPAIGLVSVT